MFTTLNKTTATRWHNKTQIYVFNIQNLTKKEVYTLYAYFPFLKVFILQPIEGPIHAPEHVAVNE